MLTPEGRLVRSPLKAIDLERSGGTFRSPGPRPGRLRANTQPREEHPGTHSGCVYTRFPPGRGSRDRSSSRTRGVLQSPPWWAWGRDPKLSAQTGHALSPALRPGGATSGMRPCPRGQSDFPIPKPKSSSPWSAAALPRGKLLSGCGRKSPDKHPPFPKGPAQANTSAGDGGGTSHPQGALPRTCLAGPQGASSLQPELLTTRRSRVPPEGGAKAGRDLT